MNPLPCKDCITLPICRSIFDDNALVFDYGVARLALVNRCSILMGYLIPPPYSKKSIIRLRQYAFETFMAEGKIIHEEYL